MASHLIDPNGLKVRVTDTTVQFGTDAPMAVPFRPTFPRAGVDCVVCVPGEDASESSWGGKTYILRRGVAIPEMIATWRARGNNPVMMHPDGTAYLIGQTASQYFTSNGGVLSGPFPTPNPDHHLGFASVTPLRMHIGAAHPTLGLKLWQECEGFVLGEQDDSWYVVDPGGRRWMATNRYSPWCHTIGRLADGRMAVAFSGDAGPTWITPEQWALVIPAPVPPTVTPETVLKFARPMFLGAYDTLKDASTTPRLIGNVGFPDKSRVRDCPLPLILAYDTLPYTEGAKWSDYAAIMNRTLYYYVHCSGAGMHTGQAQWDRLMEEPEKPVIVYLDGRNWPSGMPSWMDRDRTLLAVQCYPLPTEDVDEFRAAMVAMCDKVKAFGVPMVITPCFYDQNGTLLIQQVLAHMPTYEYLVQKYPIVGIMPFSDQRADGMQKYPQLYDWLLRWLQAIPTRPNRYQWWTPSDPAEAKRALKNLVSYDIAGFSPAQEEELHALIDAS